jgi:hypothetical protein
VLDVFTALVLQVKDSRLYHSVLCSVSILVLLNLCQGFFCEDLVALLRVLRLRNQYFKMLFNDSLAFFKTQIQDNCMKDSTNSLSMNEFFS